MWRAGQCGAAFAYSFAGQNANSNSPIRHKPPGQALRKSTLRAAESYEGFRGGYTSNRY